MLDQPAFWARSADHRAYRRKVLLDAAVPSNRRAGLVPHGETQPMMGTVLMEFFGLPSMTRSLYET
jgi:hypothetical protein